MLLNIYKNISFIYLNEIDFPYRNIYKYSCINVDKIPNPYYDIRANLPISIKATVPPQHADKPDISTTHFEY